MLVHMCVSLNLCCISRRNGLGVDCGIGMLNGSDNAMCNNWGEKGDGWLELAAVF